MRFSGTQTWGWQNAMIGMRLPFSKNYEDAQKKSDTIMLPTEQGLQPQIGVEDMRILKNLIKADKIGAVGQPNSKVMRMLHVQVAIEAPLCWWKEMDTYKVATVANSTSTMHRIQTYPIDEDCFEKNPFTGKVSGLIHLMELEDKRCEFNDMTEAVKKLAEELQKCPNDAELEKTLETLRKEKKSVWYDLIYGLGDSWLQTRMFDLNYQSIREMVYWRKNHIQNCWSGKDNDKMDNFIAWAKTLPYSELLEDDCGSKVIPSTSKREVVV